MSEFLRHFLRDDPRDVASGQAQGIQLGVYGKHPGWNDHIEEDPRTPDLGLRTPSLVAAKQILYVNGIGAQIDRAAWDQLEEAQCLGGFDHWLLWYVGDQIQLIRLWSSTDGKGRARYPMVVAAHLVGVPVSWALSVAMPRLETLRKECQETNDATVVAAAVARARQELAGRVTDGAAMVDASGAFLRLVEAPQFSPDSEGLLRVLYQIETGATPYKPGRFSKRDGEPRPFEIRLPRVGASPAEEFLGWSRLFRTLLDADAPVLLMAPVAAPWLDAVVGEPGPEQWFCLRANTAKVPAATEIPYNMNAEFRARARQALENLARAPASPAPPQSGSRVSQFLSSIFRRR